jgi:hypothetical protein
MQWEAIFSTSVDTVPRRLQFGIGHDLPRQFLSIASPRLPSQSSEAGVHPGFAHVNDVGKKGRQ